MERSKASREKPPELGLVVNTESLAWAMTTKGFHKVNLVLSGSDNQDVRLRMCWSLDPVPSAIHVVLTPLQSSEYRGSGSLLSTTPANQSWRN